MGRRRRHHSNGGMFGGLRRHIRQVGSGAIGLIGLGIAAAPAINAAAAVGSNYQAIPNQIASAYGINIGNPQNTDLGRVITTVLFPVAGALIFIVGMRAILKRV